MLASIKDNGNSGTGEANNREYGGNIVDGKIVLGNNNGAAPVSSLLDGEAKPVEGLSSSFPHFHSHPSGTIPTASHGMITATGSTCNFSFSETTNIPHYVQLPSPKDVNNSTPGMVNYVFGMSDRSVYVYTRDGVQAVIKFTDWTKINK